MLLVKRLEGNILPFVILLSCLSGISYPSHVKGNLEAFLPSATTSISLADGNTTSRGNFCVAIQNAEPNALKSGIEWACGPGLANCSSIQPGQPCYVANNLVAIASYAYDAYYQAYQAKGGTCFFNNTATITSNDPSSGSCIFPGSYGTGTNPPGSGSSGNGAGNTNSSSSVGPSFAPPFAQFVPIDDDNGASGLQVLNFVFLSSLVLISLQKF
ncbi:glucan endo-1,3-beta-glucosidase 1-like [Phalaenopsis equestris]|uniref:glucan endo-1,3-beta-glucosidase 1-like n=1 Tax=Phalaenopsis equestris TaxID=78828 RepID=UPI0009E52369|nr:glucan endo-1,3-beta-glucosidase 1-like [Phalaenopsis equestris]XP_020579040.1 glucan endo-1,3-beta-glucosidase 1-like [Phalaenopsis equestris]